MSDPVDKPPGAQGGVKALRLELDAETSKGHYANLALIAHTQGEFFLDFALAYPQQPPRVASRIVTSPQHAKALLRSLEDNIRRYEARFGPIREPAPRDDSDPN